MKKYRVVDESKNYTSEITAFDLRSALDQYAREFHSVGVREFNLTVRVFQDGMDVGEWFVTSEMVPEVSISMKVTPEMLAKAKGEKE